MRARASLLLMTALLLPGAALLAAPPADTPRVLELTPVDSEPARAGGERLDRRIIELTAAVDADPRDRRARFDLVRALRAAGQLEEAVAAARAWRDRDAYNLVVVRTLGDLLAELGRRDEARRVYSAVVELLPEDARAHRALATVLEQAGDLEAAYHRLQVASGLAGDDPRLAFELADLAHRLDRLDEARDRLRAIIEDDDTPEAVRYPAKQRLGQVLGALRREALTDGDADASDTLAAELTALALPGGLENDIKVFLTWDTDRTDVDLHVVNPAGEVIKYDHKTGRFGGTLFDDVTTGYGPESFTAKTAAPGRYEVRVHFYGGPRGAFREARGEVAIVLHEGTAGETRHVLPYRLFDQKQRVTVAHIDVSAPQEVK